MWLMKYRGHNHAVIRLQLELLGYWFTIAPRTGNLMANADYFSRTLDEGLFGLPSPVV
jgi:hypothetical protein